jgi:hypothetical protein
LIRGKEQTSDLAGYAVCYDPTADYIGPQVMEKQWIRGSDTDGSKRR